MVARVAQDRPGGPTLKRTLNCELVLAGGLSVHTAAWSLLFICHGCLALRTAHHICQHRYTAATGFERPLLIVPGNLLSRGLCFDPKWSAVKPIYLGWH